MTKRFIDRRKFIGMSGICAAIPASWVFPSSTLSQTRTKILWTGIHILQSCVSGNECKVESEFPRILPILNNQEYLPKINIVCRGDWGTVFGKNQGLQLTWQRRENNYRIDPDVTLGAFVGIAADTVLGAAYTANLNRTLTLYGMQTYLLIFDVDKFKILQSFPMRIMSARDDEGNIGIKDELISSELLNHLGYRPPNKDRKNIWLPNLIRENLNKVNPRETQPVNLRVTDVTVTKFTQKWLDKQKKDKNLYQGFLGHSLTQSISEIFKIGIQPHSPSKATLTITESFVGGGRSTNLLQKNFNTAPIDFELRARVRGIVSKEKPLKRYKNAVKKKSILILFSVEGGRWARTYAAADKQRIYPPKSIVLKERTFRHEIKILLEELRTDEFGNDWQMVLDLQQRAIDWFVKGLYAEEYQKLATGLVQRGNQRFLNMRVNAKDVDKFITEAKALRAALLPI